MRFFAAVLIGGAVFGALMPGMPAFELLSQAPLLRVLSLVLVALVIGFVGTRRGWLAAATAYVIGIALWLGIYVHPSPPWAPSDNWSVVTWLYNVVGVGLAGALLFAFIAYIGSRIAARVPRIASNRSGVADGPTMYWRVLATVVFGLVLVTTLLYAVRIETPPTPIVRGGGSTATPAVTAAVTTSAPATATLVPVVSPSPVFAASECTNATATTRQVIERYFALSTSNDPRAVTDCFAQSWRAKSPQYAAGSELWSHSGPANNLVVTPVDTVNGCDRFTVTAQMPNNRFWTGGQVFFSVGPEAVNSTQPFGGPPPGRMRIYETGTALLNASNTTLRCG